MQERDMAGRNLILKFLAGSHAYGMSTPDSDKDYLGVFIPDEEYVLGNKKCEQVQIRTNDSGSGKKNTKEDVDCVIYSLPKFLQLLTANNPTILETLFFPKNCVLFCNDFGQRLLDNRMLFPSKKFKWTTLGYSHTQKKAMTNKKERWEVFNEGLARVKKWEEEGLKVLPERLHLHSELREDRTHGQHEKGTLVSSVKDLLQKEIDGYGWRIETIKTHNYDTKFGAHLIRLLDEGLMMMVENELRFPLPTNTVLRDIKLGKYTLAQVLEMAEHKEKLVEEAYLRTTLPTTANLEAIEKLQIGMLKDFWGYR